METIEENIKDIRERIARAAVKSGRREEDITLIAVSKFVEPDRMREASLCGINNFGENYVQELLSKTFLIQDSEIHLHFIGHLQKNKIKYIVDKVSLIQSVDSVGLASEISRLAERRGVTSEVLLQVNIGYEETKSGILPESLAESLEQVAKLPSLRIRGLMAIPPAEREPGEACRCFEKMRRFFESLKNGMSADFDILSMGMSGDFEEAILEGSTMVRIGTAIFGHRLIKKV